MATRAFLVLMVCDSRWKVQGLRDQLRGPEKSERKGVRRTDSTVRAPGPGSQHLRALREGRGPVVGTELGWGCLEGSVWVASSGGWVRCGGAYLRGIASG